MKKLDPKSPEFRELVNKTINFKLNLPPLNQKKEEVIKIPIQKSPIRSQIPKIQTEVKSQIQKPTLTYNKDTDLIVLANLDDESLFSLCEVNKYTREICKTDWFWEMRIKEKFGEHVLILNKKPKNVTWIAYYKHLQYLSFSSLEQQFRKYSIAMLKFQLKGRGLKQSGNKSDMVKRLIENEVKLKQHRDTITVRLKYFKQEIPVQINKYNTPYQLRNVVTNIDYRIYLFIPKNIYVPNRKDITYEDGNGIYKQLRDDLPLAEQGVGNNSILSLGDLNGPHYSIYLYNHYI